MLQVLTGLFLRFLRMLEFAMRFSEFLLRRPVLFIASTLFDSSLSTLLVTSTSRSLCISDPVLYVATNFLVNSIAAAV